MIVKKNLFKKVIGMAIFQTATIFFYIGTSFKKGATIPILEHHAEGHGDHHIADHAATAIESTLYANPLPHVLMLTAIVVGVATLGVALVLIERIYETYGSNEEDEILRKLNH